jgi:mRNA interferase MazF
MAAAYAPGRGDLVWIAFDPQAGHEQAGRRPALVISPREYNSKVGLAVLCPVTTAVRGYPFEVALPAGLAVGGVVLSDQLKSLDWRARKAKFISTLPQTVTAEVLARVRTLVT